RTIINALEEELSGIPTVAKFAAVQKEGNRQVVRKVEYYNLEIIAIQKTIVDGAKTKEKFLEILKAL
ncbi:MAG: hypothetical protein J6U33_01045, partial [Paludibacteraceae bacterium]|nr:hypothetical protein [Paludibacteraceae bacterium]